MDTRNHLFNVLDNNNNDNNNENDIVKTKSEIRNPMQRNGHICMYKK